MNDPAQQLLDPVEEIESLHADLVAHLTKLNLPSWASATDAGSLTKAGIREIHSAQRRDVLQREKRALGARTQGLLHHFADGSEVVPEAIDPELVPVRSDDDTSDLFRLATLLWSVPVSKGYGRRMRYLVQDRSNGKLLGIFALTDPVFNLRARDEWIGWDVDQRRAGLVHVMDAYVIGAVPPYSYILGGKLVASLIGSREVSEAFAKKYARAEGIISKKQKSARLALVTVTSALGRSSLYNRLRLTAPSAEAGPPRVLVQLIRLGRTIGFGHFQLSEPLFQRLRRLVISKQHDYGNGHAFGDGPNWRMRLSRVGLAMVGLDPDLLRHGISREIYAMPLAANFREFLTGETAEPSVDRPSVARLGQAALTRWVIPRSQRDDAFRAFRHSEVAKLLE